MAFVEKVYTSASYDTEGNLIGYGLIWHRKEDLLRFRPNADVVEVYVVVNEGTNCPVTGSKMYSTIEEAQAYLEQFENEREMSDEIPQ